MTDKPPGRDGPGDQVPPNKGPAAKPPFPTPENPEHPSAPRPGSDPGTPSANGELPRVRTERDVFESYNDRFDIWWERNRFALVRFPELHYGTSVQGRSDVIATEAEMLALRAEAVSLMLPLLRHPQGRVRSAAALGLGKLKAQAAFEDLRLLLDDPESTVRDAACLALGLLGDPRADHLLLHYVSGTSIAGNPQPDTLAYRRGIAAVALALGRSRTTPRLLLSLAKAEDLQPEVRAFVFSALGTCGDAGYLPDLAPFTDDESLHVWIRQALYVALGKLGGASAMPLLVRGLRSNQSDVARSSAIGLGLNETRGDSALTDVLEQVVVASDDVALRNFATISLGRIGGPGANRALTRSLVRGRQQQVPWAALGLGLLVRGEPSPGLVDLLLQRLRTSNNVDHRSALCLALGLTGSHQAESALIAELDSAQPKVAGFAAAGLGLLNSSAASIALTGKAMPGAGGGRVVSPLVAQQIAFAWSLIDDEPSLKGLFDLFESESRPEVRLEAARAIGHIGRIDAFPRLKRSMQSNQTDALRLSEAVVAMGTLLAIDRTPVLSRVMADTNFADEAPTFRELSAYLW
jgi:HEAT repeat protein